MVRHFFDRWLLQLCSGSVEAATDWEFQNSAALNERLARTPIAVNNPGPSSTPTIEYFPVHCVVLSFAAAPDGGWTP